MSHTEEAWNEEVDDQRVKSVGWKELYLKEDWWAIWLGLGIVVIAYLFFVSGGDNILVGMPPAHSCYLRRVGRAFPAPDTPAHAAVRVRVLAVMVSILLVRSGA